MIRRSLTFLVTASALPLAAGTSHGQEAVPGMVRFDEIERQPIGMEWKAVEDFLEKELKSPLSRGKDWPDLKADGFMTMTPAHHVPVPAFRMARYETTNAQWDLF